MRQTSIRATPSYTPVVRLLTFPAYEVPEGQRLLLQLEPADHTRRHVVFGLALPHRTLANLALNGVPDAGSGPLAFARVVTGSGLRAALDGMPDARNRLRLALILTGLTVLAHPHVQAWAGRWPVGAVAKRLTHRAGDVARRLAAPRRQRDASDAPKGRARALAVPWYPWPVALIPVLHFLAVNSLHFSIAEALAPSVAILLVVTLAMGVLRILMKSWHRAATALTSVLVVVFAYGHVTNALDAHLDDQALFPAAVVLAAALLGLGVQRRVSMSGWAPFLNLTAGALLLFQVINLAAPSTEATLHAPQYHPQVTKDVRADPPDVYHIILDAYGRHDALGEYDNSGFLKALEERGFYVARQATSNYTGTLESLASSLNLVYLHDIEPHSPTKKSEAVTLIQNNALAATFKSLGYTYIHLESGHIPTNRAPQADILVTFTPAGIVQSASGRQLQSHLTAHAAIRQSVFARALIETTALRPIIGHRFLPGKDDPYDYYSPARTLQMFAFLSKPIETSAPKYVFAHILKPHFPFTFDRHGNMMTVTSVEDGFSDSHDPAVPNAYIGQLIYINSLVLRMVDSIFENSVEKPIIVIASDHNSRRAPNRNRILAAFHLPNGGNNVLYPSISSVNHFRSILDYYFDLRVGLLEDVTLSLDLDDN
ncbi:MAG: hypothetical protein OXP73_03625 [Chloroflexota bacterium]|nr:hypothetical protein [Chloroflexota bacterium]